VKDATVMSVLKIRIDAGAKAQLLFAAFAARLKSCPVTKRRRNGAFS
jgi:hypothetical protein